MCNFFPYYGYTHCRRALEMAEIRKSDLDEDHCSALRSDGIRKFSKALVQFI